MAGGAGDDVYFVDDMFDFVFEEAEAGFDVIVAEGTDFVWMADGVEALYIIGENLGAMGTDGGDVIVGGETGNWLLGGGGDDTILGGGGANVLMGGDGRDQFVVDGEEVEEVILDFTHGDDILWLVGQGLSSFEEALAGMWQDEDGVILLLDTGYIWFDGATLGSFTAADFGFA